MTETTRGTSAFRAARDLLLQHREDYDAARSQFCWPQLDEFNWALDWFDVLAAEQPDAGALRVVTEDSDTRLSYAELAARSNQVANWLRGLGVSRGDRLLLMLGNITVRDGYGQTETTAQIGNPPGQPVRIGSMGRELPGYEVTLVDPLTGGLAGEGEICLDLARRPLGLMTGYRGDPERAADAMRGGYYHTGDVAARDADGYITYVGRTDDLFKASDYRISPFELESVLIEHEAVAEAAVVPSPDPLRLAVPKAYVVLAAGFDPSADTALAILAHARERLAPYKRIRRLEFAELPKTISGKIRRVELRAQEDDRHAAGGASGTGRASRGAAEFWEDDFPGLKA